MDDHWRWVEALAAAGVRVRVSHDVAFGVDRASGWSVSVGGEVRSQFLPTAREAIVAAVLDVVICSKAEPKG